MTSSSLEHTTQPANTYVIDAESAAEQARLLDQDTLLTEAMGGPLSEQGEEALRGVRDVLDIGCGPGGWVQRVARDYPHMQVTGVDLSATMIAYARAMAGVMRLDNAHFRLMDATGPLAFPDACFDLVNARLVSGFLLPAHWPLLLAECHRLLRPGGMVRLAEGEWGIVTAAAPATARLFGLGLDALRRAGRSFSPDGRYHAITPMLRQFLRRAGFGGLGGRGYALDHSFGTEAHGGFCENYQVLFKLGQPFILQQGLATQEELDALYERALCEMLAEEFGALLYLLTVWGRKEEGMSTQTGQEALAHATLA
jgi:SAM-dependent methyltransferase